MRKSLLMARKSLKVAAHGVSGIMHGNCADIVPADALTDVKWLSSNSHNVPQLLFYGSG